MEVVKYLGGVLVYIMGRGSSAVSGRKLGYQVENREGGSAVSGRKPGYQVENREGR